jgi:enoyl-CoA hydratase/carnithine racemase
LKRNNGRAAVSESSTDVLKLEYQGQIAVMTLNNPKRVNAFTLAMRELMYTPR